MRLNKLARLLLGIGVFASCSLAFAASAENEYVVVTCDTQGVVDIIPVDDDFYITTRGVSSPPFEADIGVVAKTPWKLLVPADGKMELEIGEYGVYKVEDETGLEDDVEGRIYVLKLDIEQDVKIVCRKSNSASLNVTSDSVTGGVEWSSNPIGIGGTGDSVNFTPSSLLARDYTVYARSSLIPGYRDECTVRVIDVEILRNEPSNPCLVDSGIDYVCKVMPIGTLVDNYTWRYYLGCYTDSTDPYTCNAGSGHNASGVGPSGSNASTWTADDPGSLTEHVGEHEITCEVEVGGIKCLATMQQKVEPKIEVSNVTLLSPASDKSWPYDPVWHDVDWEPTIDGSSAMECSYDVDSAGLSYELNKDSEFTSLTVYQKGGFFEEDDDIFSFNAPFDSKGVHEWPSIWSIYLDNNGKYYAKVSARGFGLIPGDMDSENSPEVAIERRQFYMTDVQEAVESARVGQNWQYTDEVHQLIIGTVISQSLTIGAWYLGVWFPALTKTIWGAIATSELGVIISVAEGSTPSSLQGNNWIYYYGPWNINDYRWDGVRYESGGSSSSWQISAYEVWHHNITTVPPPDGVVPEEVCYRNRYTDERFDEDEMVKTPWSAGLLEHNAYGLLPPVLVPSEPSQE